MTLEERINSVLDAAAPEGALDIPTEHGGAVLDIACLDAMSCELHSLRFAPRLADGTPPRDWQETADQIVSKVRYLSEPLALIESDAEAEQAQVRSMPPREEEQGVAYFECLASPHEILLKRYRKTKGAARAAITFRLTRDSLAQLLGDIDAICQRQSAPRVSVRQRFLSLRD